MKEIYKIPKGQNVATSEGWKHIDTEIKNFVYETEQVPETWEELKELCKDLESKDVFITSAGDCIEYHGLQFWVSGTVCHETEKFYSIKSDRTPQQMWNIIKSLIGEE